MFVVVFILFISLFAPGTYTSHDSLDAAPTAPAQSRHKSLVCLEKLHKKLLDASTKSGIRFHKPKTYQRLREEICVLCNQQEPSDRNPLSVLETHLENLHKLKTKKLFASSQDVITLTNKASKALKDHAALRIVTDLKKDFLPKNALVKAMPIELKAACYTAAGFTALATLDALCNPNPRRNPSPGDSSSNHAHRIQHTSDGFSIEILMPHLAEQQGHNCCALNASANHVTFAQELKNHPEFSTFSDEEKKRFLTSIRFKSNKEISDECVAFTQKYKLNPPLEYKQSYERPYLTYLEKELGSFDCALCNQSITTHDHGHFHYSSSQPHADNINDTEPFQWLTHNLAFFDKALRDNALKEDPLTYILKEVRTYSREYWFLYNNYRNELNPCCHRRGLISEIIAFNQGKAVVMMASVQTLKTLGHAIANVFFKTSDGACIIYKDSLFRSPESFYVKDRIHPALIEICTLFLKYGEVCQFLEDNKAAIERFLGWTES